ncbi:hypothetical protein ACW7BC_22225 [Azospirillum argentinense]
MEAEKIVLWHRRLGAVDLALSLSAAAVEEDGAASYAIRGLSIVARGKLQKADGYDSPLDGAALDVTRRLPLPETLSDSKLDARLFEPVNEDDPDAGFGTQRIKPWQQIQSELDSIAADMRRKIQAAVEDVRRALSRYEVTVSGAFGFGTDSDFFGIRRFGASVLGRYTVELHPPSLLPPEERVDDRPVFRATATADAQLSLYDRKIAAALTLRLELDGAGLTEILADVHDPQLPDLRFDLPRMRLPHLNFSDLGKAIQSTWALIGPTLKPFHMPLPGFGVAVKWTTPPKFTVDVTDAGGDPSLALATMTAGVGELVIALPGEPEHAVAKVTGFAITIPGSGSAFEVSGTLGDANNFTKTLPGWTIDERLTGPVTVRLSAMMLSFDFEFVKTAGDTTPLLTFTLTHDIGRIEIRAKEDPEVVLALKAKAIGTLGSDGSGRLDPGFRLTDLQLIEPYPVKLIGLAAEAIEQGAERLWRYLSEIHFNQPGLPDLPDGIPNSDLAPLVDRLERLLSAIVTWIAKQAGALGQALAGMAKAVADFIGDLVRKLRGLLSTPGQPGLAVGFTFEIRLEPKTLAVRQIMLAPITREGETKSLSAEFLGFQVELAAGLLPALLFDMRDKWSAVLLIPVVAEPSAVISTDLWLDTTTGGEQPTEAAPDTDADGTKPDSPLVKVTAKVLPVPSGSASPALVLVQLSERGPVFFRKLAGPKGSGDVVVTRRKVDQRVSLAFGGFQFVEDWSDEDFSATVALNVDKVADKASGFLPFLKKSKAPAHGAGNGTLLDRLQQYVKVKKLTPPVLAQDKARLDIDIEIRLADLTSEATLSLELNLSTLHARLLTDKKLAVRGAERTQPFLGLEATIKSRNGGNGEFEQFTLDFSDGDARLVLSDQARVELAYRQVAARGRGLVFRADNLVVSRDGVDLKAEIDPAEPVTLAGVDTAFRFKGGALSVKRTELQSFSIQGTGQLPPALIGEAYADVAIAFGRDQGGALTVVSATGDVDRAADPIVCEATRFRFTLTNVGFQFVRAEGTHFYFTLTGSAEFAPRPGEFESGLLKNLSRTKIVLHQTPLAGDPRVLARHIEFQVPIEPALRTSIFDLFGFELRGIGFHPASPAFDDDPALSISGQIRFAKFGDVPSMKFDFHQLWLAPPRPGGFLPRVRLDGLGLALSLGSMARISGTAIAVDDKLPSIFRPDVLPANVTANGFLASAQLAISGWPDMTASAGFLELRHRDELRHAFFVYGELARISQPIPTPIGTIYLREAGFGFGFRYTFAGLAQADQVSTPRELVRVLDEVSKRQGQLHDVRAWEPEAEGDRLTLAMRALFTTQSMSPPGTYDDMRENPRDVPDEKKPANYVLFDVVAALRSDLTFLMAARAWICVNYADWVDGRGEDWQSKPSLRGYLYISVPRKQFLGRFIGDPDGHIGNHPPLPAPLRAAFGALRWSSTLYIDETVYHHEFGWPYELGFTLRDDNGNFEIVCDGGMVMRIEDLSYLTGLAFRAHGFAKFSGRVGGESLGASADALAQFALDGKLITYISARKFSESFYYGALQIDVTIRFDVRVWVSFTIWKHEIRLEAGFSLSLTVSVGVELVLAARTPIIGGRLTASIGVGAFGRTLRIGVGLTFNDGLLDQARARVARFMQLGLGASYPDPERGVPAPQPAADRKRTLEAGDASIQREAERRDTVAPPLPPGTKPEPAVEPVGDPVGDTQYWAIIYPTRVALPDADAGAGEDEETTFYLLQIVPRDHTLGPEAKIAAAVPAKGGDAAPPFQDIDPGAGTFYVAPRPQGEPSTGSYAVTLDEEVGLFCWLGTSEKGELRPPVRMTRGDNGAAVAWQKVLAKEGDAVLRLQDLLQSAFLAKNKNGALTQPRHRPFNRQRMALPADAAEAARVLGDASRDRGQLAAVEAASAAVEERRSAFIATVCETASRLAEAGGALDAAWTSVGQGLDARDFGLTFVIGEKALGKLIRPGAASDPPLLRMRIKASGATNPGSVRLYNPVERHFHRAPPRLADATAVQTGASIVLNWDLEPGWGASAGIYEDPEYHLKHYVIRRRILLPERPAPPPRQLTVKTGAPIAARDMNGTLTWTILRPAYQFVDDLQDLSDELRRALTLPAPDGAGSGTPPSRRTAWDTAIGRNVLSVRVEYTVVAVDLAGTHSDPEIVVATIERPLEAVAAFRRATLVFAYEGLPSYQFAKVDDAWTRRRAPPDQAPVLTLFLEDALLDAAEKRHAGAAWIAARDEERYREIELRLWGERAVSAGLYGVDALTDALRRPTPPGARAGTRPNETDVVLARTGPVNEGNPHHVRIVWRVAKQGERDGYMELDPLFYEVKRVGGATGQAWEKLLAALGVDAEPQARGIRAHVRPAAQVRPAWDDRDKPPAADWTTADLLLRINRPEPKLNSGQMAGARVPDVETVIEVFEHPLDVRFAPIGFADAKMHAGRLLVRHPAPGATLDDLLGDKAATSTVLLRDGERRVATRLVFNARPDTLALTEAPGGIVDPDALSALIGGYDIFSIDLDALSRSLVAPKRLREESDSDFEKRQAAFRRDKAAECTRQALHLGRVQLLPRRLRGVEPAETGDLAKVEALYPSETLRLAGRDAATRPPGGARRHPFLSGAESILLWPNRLVRRFLLPNPPDELIDALFANGMPVRLRITLEGWPAAAQSPMLCATGLVDGRDEACAAPLTVAAPSGPLSPDQIRRVLHDLTWCRDRSEQGDPPSHPRPDPADALLATTATAFDGVKLRLEALKIRKLAEREEEFVIASTTIGLELVGLRHAVLADLVERLRFDNTEMPLYRRYEPMIEAPPAVKAKTLNGYMDEVPPERDPYGWGVLRSFGLAVSLRLFDTAEGAYAVGARLLQHVRETYQTVLAAYASALPEIGAPFVDVLARPAGLFEITSLDGGTPAATCATAEDFVNNQSLALVQLSVRPVADRLKLPTSAQGCSWAADRPVRYVRLKVLKTPENSIAAGKNTVTMRLPDTTLGCGAMIDVIDVTGGTVVPRVFALGRAPLRTHLGEEAAVTTATLDLGALEKGKTAALLRVVTFNSQDNATPETVIDALRRDWDGKLEHEFIDLPHVLDKTPGPDPFGLFKPLPAPRLALLGFGAKIAGKNDQGKDVQFELKPHRAVAPPLDAFLANATACGFAPPSLDTPQQQEEAAGRLAGWTRRFLDHGPALRLDKTSRGSLPLLAVATIPRPDPWRVAPGARGEIEVLLPVKDRFGHLWRYVVRPFGRYDNIAQAVIPDRAKPTLVGAFDKRIGGAGEEPDTFDVFADAVVPRTEPVAAPVILSARRLDAPEKDPRDPKLEVLRPGRTFELVLARHPEEVLSEANRRVEGGLALRELAVGFWREFAAVAWAKRLPLPDGIKIDFGAGFGAAPARGERPPDTAPAADLGPLLATPDEELVSLQNRVPDVWSGAHVLRFTALPYGFRIHALAYAAAGAVVSDTVGTTLEEARYTLALPWLPAVDVPDEAREPSPFRGRTRISPPCWEANRVVNDKDKPVVRVTVHLPLVRFIDGVDGEARAVWFGKTKEAPLLFSVIDPGVSYRLGFEAGGGAVVEPQVEIMPAPAEGADTDPFYFVQVIGTRFVPGAMQEIRTDSAPSVLAWDRSDAAWRMDVALEVHAEDAVVDGARDLALLAVLQAVPPPDPAERAKWVAGKGQWIAERLAPFFDFVVNPGRFSKWRLTAPMSNAATVAWDTPKALDGSGKQKQDAAGNLLWDREALAAAARAWDDALAAYGALVIPAVEAIRPQLADLVMLTGEGPRIQGSAQVADWVAGLPRPAAETRRIVDLRLEHSSFTLPTVRLDDCARAIRSQFEAIAATITTDAEILRENVVVPLVRAMRQHWVARKRTADERSYGGVPRFVRLLAAAERAPLTDGAASALADVAPDVVSLVRAWRVTAARPTIEAIDEPFLALEKLRGGADALEALGQLEDSQPATGPASVLDIRVPVRGDGPALTALRALGSVSVGDIVAVVLDQPPQTEELAGLEAKAAEVLAGDAAAFMALLRQAATDQLFGPGRRMIVDAYHGLARPQRAVIVRRPGQEDI